MTLFRKAIGVLIFAKVIHYICLMVYLTSPNAEILPFQPGPCKQLKGIVQGSEDFAAVGDGRYIIASGLVDTQHPAMYKGRSSQFYVFDMNEPFKTDPQPLSFSAEYNVSEFAVHGISLKHHEAGSYELLSVNHHSSQDTVERFSLNLHTNKLTHIGTTKWDGFGTLNDIEWADDGFYFSCYLWSKRSNPFIKLEFFIVEMGFLGYCDFRKGCRRLSSSLGSPNGITLSKDKKYLYVAQTIRKEILVYRRGLDNELTLIQTFDAGYYLDNVHLSDDGRSLGAGAYTNLIQLLKHLQDPDTPMYAIAVHYAVDPQTGLLSGGVLLFADRGRHLSACTSAQIHGNYVLLGSISHRSLVCRVDVNRNPSGLVIT